MLTKPVSQKGGPEASCPMPNVFRLQVELDADLADEIGKLQILGGMRTKKDVIENALVTFKWAAREKALGAAILAIDAAAGSYSELQMPVLEVIAAKAAKRQKSASWKAWLFGRLKSARRSEPAVANGPRPVRARRR
jgi:hypothetical protein